MILIHCIQTPQYFIDYFSGSISQHFDHLCIDYIDIEHLRTFLSLAFPYKAVWVFTFIFAKYSLRL